MMRNRSRGVTAKRTIVGLACIALLCLASVASAQNRVSMDFANVDIKVVIKYISDLTGKNFVIDEKVQGNVTIVSPRKVSDKEAYKVFESILEVYGFTTVPTGDVIKIVPLAEARQMSGKVEVGDRGSRVSLDRVVTQLIPLANVSAENMLPVIRPLVSPTSFVTAYAPSNTLILVDTEGNRARILEIVRELDVEGTGSQVAVYRLKHASADELEKKITQLLLGGAKNKPDHTLKVIADERINALIVMGAEIYLVRVQQLIEKLDIESPPGRDEVHVVYLKNANATEMAKVIGTLATLPKNTKKRAGQPNAAPISDVQITADAATNSLLITASPEDFVTVEKVIEKLDIRRRQVFVEALIFEITTTDAQKFGVEWRTTSNFTDSNAGVQGIGGTNFGEINQVSSNPFSAGQGLVLGVVDGLISYNGATYANIGGLMTALQTDTGVNILSTPNLLTTDNEEAEIFVGENVPFVKSTAQTTGATPIVNIERQDVGIKLKIKPQINESDYVRLYIFQEISGRREVTDPKIQDVVTTKRSAQTTVVVKDNQNIIIGGLIKTEQQDTVNKVPVFGDIPILGWLFKSKTKSNVKTNLLIFLTPHIIDRPEDIVKITEEKQELMKNLAAPKEGQGASKDETPQTATPPADSGAMNDEGNTTEPSATVTEETPPAVEDTTETQPLTTPSPVEETSVEEAQPSNADAPPSLSEEEPAEEIVLFAPEKKPSFLARIMGKK